MASNLERITKACEEMKRLYGIPEEKVKAALKQLHNFHGNAWSRIEENNYKAILEWTSEEKISQTLEYSKRRGALSIQEGKMYQNLEPEVVHILSDDESEKPDTQLKRRKRIYNEKVLSIEDGKDTVTQKINKLELYQNGYHKPLLEEHVLKYESPIAEIHPVSDKDKGQDRKKIIYASNGGDVGNPSLKSENKSNEVPNDRRNSSAVTKSSIFVEDITRGEENEPISLVGDNSSSLKLPEFFYISRNIVYNNAYVNFSLARLSDQNYCSNCCGDCLAAPANCACTCETRGDFAYTRQGLLEEKFIDECIGVSRRRPKKEYLYYCENCPLENSSLVTDGKQQKRKKSKKACKGHLMRKFIKECWAKCGCSRICGNRVVQRGITVKLQVFQTPEGKGWGVRTLQQLEKGTFVCEYVGEIVTNLELHERNERSAGDEHTYPVLLDADWASERHLKDEDALCLDATKFGNVARFINHRCYDANLVEVPVEVETPDHHYYHIAFFTSRKIEANEELTWDYGIDFEDETHPIKAFDCKCGSFFCGMKNRSSR